MVVIKNNIIPFPGYKAMNICGILFVRKNAPLMTAVDLNHEAIHSKLIFEMLIVFFYLWYLIEWFIRYFFSKDKFTHKAYRNISFEQEAYGNQEDLNYIEWRRKPYAWLHLIK